MFIERMNMGYFIEALFVPRDCFGQLGFQNFKDAADWDAVPSVAVAADNRVRLEQRVDDRFFGRFNDSTKEQA